MRMFLSILSAIFLVLVLSGCDAVSGKSSGAAREDATSKTGYYIPHDLEDALLEVDRIMGEKGRSEVREVKSNYEMAAYHLGLGMWIRNNWGLRAGSQLSHYFNRIGIENADDMSGIILDSYWRRLHDKPLDLEGQVRRYQDYWKKMKAHPGG